MILPWVELVVAICILVGLFRFSALCISLLLATIIVIAQASVLGRGITTNCGCFGGSTVDHIIDYSTLVRAIALISVVIVALICEWRARI